jgi:Ser/Thr protein kinase RdoA (MazF antagonist)
MAADLLHCDPRADNILLTDDRVLFVDWPCACIGPAWIDLLVVLPGVNAEGGPTGAPVSRSPVARGADRDHVTAMVAALTSIERNRLAPT